MLIVVCGPDSYRALARAKELELAFKQKHDPSGLNIERLPNGAEGVDALLSSAGTISLFAPKRFLRVSGMIDGCPKAKLSALIKLLNSAGDDLIVVDFEEEKPTEKVLAPFRETPKFLLNDYPLLSGTEYKKWLLQIAKNLRISDEKLLSRLADATDGDTWFALNELTKVAAGSTETNWNREAALSVYDVADGFLRQDASRFEALEDGDTNLPNIALQQAASYLRVRDNDLSGIPPFVANKMKRMRAQAVETMWSSSLLSLFVQRTGFSDSEEASLLMK